MVNASAGTFLSNTCLALSLRIGIRGLVLFVRWIENCRFTWSEELLFCFTADQLNGIENRNFRCFYLMSTSLENTDSGFNQILLLIKEAKNRVYAKANKELVLLNYNVGKVVSEKVNTGNWGDETVQELADFIASKQPEQTGFNRRGLYRMKQFYETYSDPKIVRKVSTALTQIQRAYNQVHEFVSTVLTQIQWSSHWPISSIN
nr:DUF1016 family protein [Cytophagales bacterium]